MTTTATVHVGKTDFVRDVLTEHPYANTAFVNEEWTAAGRDGKISATLVNKLRSSMGLAGNLRSTTKKVAEPATGAKVGYTGKKRGRKPKQPTFMTNDWDSSDLNGVTITETKNESPSPNGFNADYEVLEELEADFDRLLFKVMGLGGLPKIEESLRQTRRLLYGGFAGNGI